MMKESSPSTFAHLKSILSLPFMVIIVIPSSILTFSDTSIFEFFHLINDYLLRFTSLFFFIMGLFLMIRTISLFGKKGKGTLAPWNPTKRLVIIGPYRYVRNPMILGVLLILTSISFAFKSENVLAWMIFFFVLNTVYFKLKEEPDLGKRFGNEYLEYSRNVPRWIPRITPWEK